MAVAAAFNLTFSKKGVSGGGDNTQSISSWVHRVGVGVDPDSSFVCE